VLTDVVRTMYSPKFLTELFKPQDVYTNRVRADGEGEGGGGACKPQDVYTNRVRHR
jgi:hypothetical protein